MKAYVYAIVVDGVVRYVGKGHGNRHAAHMKKVRSIARRRAVGETVFATLLYNRLTKAWLNGALIEIQIIAEGLTDEAAFSREATEIASTPANQLWNTTPGGKGFSAEQWNNPQFCERMIAREASKRTSDYRAKRSSIIKSLWDDPEWKAAWIAKRWPQGAQGSRRDKERERRRHLKPWRKPHVIATKPGPWFAKANKGSFTSESAQIVQLNTWRDPEKRKHRLTALGRRSNGQWRGVVK